MNLDFLHKVSKCLYKIQTNKITNITKLIHTIIFYKYCILHINTAIVFLLANYAYIFVRNSSHFTSVEIINCMLSVDAVLRQDSAIMFLFTSTVVSISGVSW